MLAEQGCTGLYRHLRLCHTREQLWQLPHGPKVVLATLPSLTGGASRQLFAEWASNPAHLILFPSRAQVSSLWAYFPWHALQDMPQLPLQMHMQSALPPLCSE